MATAGSRWPRPAAAPRSPSPAHRALTATDPRAVHADLSAKGVDVDADLMGGDGTVPLLVMFRDGDGNGLMVVEER